MKLSPIISNWIRRFILKQGVAKSALVITILSMLLSALIARLVSSLILGGSGNFNFALAIIVPALIAPPFGYIFMNLYIELEKVRKEVHELAITDELTRTFNRRHFMNLAAQEFEHVKRYQHPLSIVIFDIDDFKNVNDNYGHLCGDAVLREISSTCRTILR